MRCATASYHAYVCVSLLETCTHPMNRSAPPGCLASKSVAPSPIITSDDKLCFS